MINATEVGKLFRYAVPFDLSAFTALTLKFTHSTGVAFTVTDPAVSAPAVPVTDPILGPLLASHYFQYTTTGTDFTVSGSWTVCGIYEDATPKKFDGTTVPFTVGDAC